MVPSRAGIVHTPVQVFSKDRSRWEAIDLLVDTGSTFTWIPENLLVRLGVRPSDVMRFRTAVGSILERPAADAPIECQGIRGFVGVVFARPRDDHVLGVTALERLGLEVEPRTRNLRRTDAYLAVSPRSRPRAGR